MLIDRLCSPALIYLAFSIIQLILDMSQGKFKLAIAKLFITLIFTYLLNLLCDQKLTKLSWLIVFLPFVFMGYISLLLVYALGFSDKNGNDLPIEKTDEEKEKEEKEEKEEKTGESDEDVSTLDVSAFEPFYGHTLVEGNENMTDDSELTEAEVVVETGDVASDAVVSSVGTITTTNAENERHEDDINNLQASENNKTDPVGSLDAAGTGAGSGPSVPLQGALEKVPKKSPQPCIRACLEFN